MTYPSSVIETAYLSLRLRLAVYIYQRVLLGLLMLPFPSTPNLSPIGLPPSQSPRRRWAVLLWLENLVTEIRFV